MTTTGRTPAEAHAWMLAHPHRHAAGAAIGTQGGGPWASGGASFCEQYINNAGGFSEAFGSATLAGNASGPLNKDLSTAPAGAFIYYTNHIGMSLGGGRMRCASTIFDGNGSGTGEISDADYRKRFPAQKLRGWSKRHGTQTLAPSVTAPASTGTIKPATQDTEESVMKLIWNKNGADQAYYLASDTDIVLASQIGDRAVLAALFGAAVGPLTNVQMDTVRKALAWNKANRPAGGAVTVNNDSVLAAIAALDKQSDTYQTALVKAVAGIPEGVRVDLAKALTTP